MRFGKLQRCLAAQRLCAEYRQHDDDEDPSERFRGLDRAPREQQQQQQAERAEGDVRTVAHVGRHQMAQRRGDPRGSRQHGREDHDHADEHGRPRDIGKHARPDRPRRLCGRSHRFGGCQRVDHLRSGDPAHHDNRQARTDERRADLGQGLAASSARQIDRQREHRHDQQRQDQRQAAQQVDRVLHRAELFGGHDLQLRDFRRDLFGDARRSPHLFGHFAEHRAQVEDHRAAAGQLHDAAFVLDQAHELGMGDLVGLAPQFLNTRAFEQQVDPLLHNVFQSAGGRGRERLQFAGQLFAQFSGHVDVGIQLFCQVAGHRFADRWALDQLRVRARPVARVEQLPVGPDREDRHDAENGGHTDQAAHQPAVGVSCARGRDVGLGRRA